MRWMVGGWSNPTPNSSPEREGDLIVVYFVDLQYLGAGFMLSLISK